MDVILEKKAWYIRYRYYLLAGVLLLAMLVWLTVKAFGPKSFRVAAEDIQIDQVVNGKFLEYVDVEGTVQPIMTLRVNTREGGTVARIVADGGSILEKGDTILVLENPELYRTLQDERAAWQKQANNYKEQQITMEQKSLALKQQILQAEYELKRLQKSFELDKEEFRMGIKSKAQLEVSQDEYEHKLQTAALQMESLRYDSAAAIIRRDMLQSDLEQERRKMQRTEERLSGLVVTAPLSGQLGNISVSLGQKINSGESIGEISVTDKFKLHTRVSEYYVERFTIGLQGSISNQGKRYGLRTAKVVPEVKERNFDVDLQFTDSLPDNVRIGKSYRIQIELGQSEDALVAPKGAYSQTTGGLWIYKLNASGSKAIRTEISIGRQNPRQYEILEGLQEGDRIISSDYSKFGNAEEIIIEQ